MEWKTVTAEQFCTRVTDGTHDSPKRQEVGRYLITSKHLSGSDIDFSSAYKISEEDYQKIIVRSNVEQYDILFSMIGTIGNTYRVTEEAVDYAVKNMAIFKFGGNKGDSSWFYYWLKSPQAQAYISQMQAGSTQGYLTLATLRSFPVAVPDHATQDKIVAILSSLDDKIENNNRINRNLEAQAQALFKSWFVDFEPWGGTMPEDWKEGNLGDIVTVKRGGSPRPIQDYLSDKGYKWLKISDATAEASPFISHIVEHIKEEGLSKTVFIKQGSLVLSNSATPGLPKFVDLDTCIHDGWLYFPQSYFSNEYLYLLFQRERSYLLSQGNGSVFTNLKTDIVKNLSVIIPSEDVLNSFQQIVGGVFMEILNNQRESSRLATLRDTLLPKLMKGEIAL